MNAFGVKMLPLEEILKQEYLKDGSWNFDFKWSYSEGLFSSKYFTRGAETGFFLTDEQTRLINIATSDLKEPLHIQGYAGTGKTYLIRALLETFVSMGYAPKTILVLAQRYNQIRAFPEDIRKKFTTKTFSHLMAEILPDNFLWLKKLTPESVRYPYGRLVAHLGLAQIGQVTPIQIISLAIATKANFCHSTDLELTAQNLPRNVEDYAHSLSVGEFETLKRVVVKSAQEMWRLTLQPPGNFDLPIRGYHQVKLAALMDGKVPMHYTHVVIDEAHDLSPAMIQILDNSKQNTLTLGDRFQKLRGFPSRRSSIIRERQLTHSYRAGTSLEELVNPVLNVHLLRPDEPFSGSTTIRTDIKYYRDPEIPGEPTTILVSDLWAMWDWIQRFANIGAKVTLMTDRSGIDEFVISALNLKNNSGVKPTHRLLGRFTNWAGVQAGHYKLNTFNNVQNILRKSYTIRDWGNIKGKTLIEKPALYRLGLAENSLNMEFDRLMLTPDIADMVTNLERPYFGNPKSVIYAVLTRTKYSLLCPVQLREWIEEISGSQSQKMRQL